MTPYKLSCRTTLLSKFKRIDDRFGLACAFFEAIREADFLELMEELLNGHGLGFDYYACDFPQVNDEQPFEGVMFTLDYPGVSKELIVSHAQFLELSKMATEHYLKFHPTDGAKLQEIFEKKGIGFVLPASCLPHPDN